MKHSLSAGFGTAAIIAIIALLALGGGYLYVNQSVSQETSVHNQMSTDEGGDEKMAQQKDEKSGDEGSVSTDGSSGDDGMTLPKEKLVENAESDDGLDLAADVSETTPTKPGSWEDYAPEKLAMAENGEVVLFFHADWCPSCRGLEKDINANLSEIPEDVHLLKVDYDTEIELKKKYGVVRQHTLVQVDANGNKIKTLNGLNNTLAQVAAQL